MRKSKQKNRHSLESHESDEVGYGRPPKHTRFKPGQSGNPKGRPRGQMNLETLVQRLLNEKVTVREGNTIRRMSKLEAVLQSMLARGLNGDAKANETILQLANEHLPTVPYTANRIEVHYVDPPGKRDYSKQIVRT